MKKRTTVFLEESQIADLALLAQRSGLKSAQLIRMAVARYIQENAAFLRDKKTEAKKKRR